MSSSGHAKVYRVDFSPMNLFTVNEILEEWSDIPEHWSCRPMVKDGIIYGISFDASKYRCICDTINSHFVHNPDPMIAIDACNEDDFYVNHHYVFFLDKLTSIGRKDIIWLHEIPEPVVYRRKKLARLLKWLKRKRLNAIDNKPNP